MVLAVLELTLKTRLSLNSYLPAFCLPSARVKDVRHHRLAVLTIYKMVCGHYTIIMMFEEGAMLDLGDLLEAGD